MKTHSHFNTLLLPLIWPWGGLVSSTPLPCSLPQLQKNNQCLSITNLWYKTIPNVIYTSLFPTCRHLLAAGTREPCSAPPNRGEERVLVPVGVPAAWDTWPDHTYSYAKTHLHLVVQLIACCTGLIKLQIYFINQHKLFLPKEELAEGLLTSSLQFHAHGCFQRCPGYEMTHKKIDDDWRDPEYLVSVDAGWTGSPWIGTPLIKMDCNAVAQSSIQCTWSQLQHHLSVYLKNRERKIVFSNKTPWR